MTAARGDQRFPQGARLRVLSGQYMTGAAALLAIVGLAILAAIGRLDHLTQGVGMFALSAIGFGWLAWLAIPRQPDNIAVWVPAWAALFTGIATTAWALTILLAHLSGLDVSSSNWNDLAPSDLPVAAAVAFELVMLGVIPGLFLMLTLWLVLFPDGELPSRRWRWIGWGAVITMAAATALLVWMYRPGSTVRYGVKGDELSGIGRLLDPLFILLVVLSGVCVGSLVVRYRRSIGSARLQYRWVGLGTVALLFVAFVVDQSEWQLLVALLAMVISVACYAMAVTKYRLYGIDIVISRTLVYGTLAVFIGGVYVIVVVVLGGRLGSGSESLTLSVAATAMVAIAFEPMRQWAQGWANRLVFGQRATPYEVLSNLTEKLAEAEEGEGILARMVRLLRDGTGADRATVWLGSPGEMEPAATWPPDVVPGEDLGLEGEETFPVLHNGEVVGALEVVKPSGGAFSSAERSLVSNLAGSAGLVLGYQRLNDSLARSAREVEESRMRLVEAQDQERRRLERDLHDGAQQLLVALKVKIGIVSRLATRHGSTEIEKLLVAIREEAQAALEDVRSLAKGIYPPVLESDGLTAAVSALAAGAPVEVVVNSNGIVRYSRDVEAAVYFNISEAVTNAVKHADPPIRIDLLESEGFLKFVVCDAGPGFDLAHANSGSGLENMEDRLDSVGGHLAIVSTPGEATRVTGEIPLEGLV